MLRRVAFTDLPRVPQCVRVLHHTSAGVLITAIAYKRDPAQSSRSPLFFTMVEMAAPNETGQPLRVVHVRVPAPATQVHAIALVQSADGADVFAVVQAAEVKTSAGQPEDNDQAPLSITTYVYRRKEVAAASRGDAKNAFYAHQDEEEEEEYDDVVESPVSTRAHKPNFAAVKVRYQRLPREVAEANTQLWTAATAFTLVEGVPASNTSNNNNNNNADVTLTALLTASSSSTSSSSSGNFAVDGASGVAENQLELWKLSGTRLSREATWRIPALDGFPIVQILTLSGTQDVALLRHRSAILEVDLAALRRACARYPHVTASNAFITRAWRWSPHDCLSAAAVKDAVLYAATEKGHALVWDLRQRAGSGAQPRCSASVQAPITGLYAPYATGFVSCDASGGVRDWRDRSEIAEEEEEEGAGGNGERMAETINGSLRNFQQNEEAATSANNGGGAVVSYNAALAKNTRGALSNLVGVAAPAAVPSSSPFPYVSRPPAEAPAGLNGCVAMDGYDNFIALVKESGALQIYYCD